MLAEFLFFLKSSLNFFFSSKKLLLCLGLCLMCLTRPVTARAQSEISPTDPAATDIVLGTSTALTGPIAFLGQDMLKGVNLRWERVNRQGGIRGRAVRMIALDDSYNPLKTISNMNRLIDEDQVLAVIGNVGTPTAIAAGPIANAKQTLFFGAFTGAGLLRKTPPDRYVINYRASYAQETRAIIDALIGIKGLRPRDIAFFTQRDGYGDAGFVGGIEALKHHGLKDSSEVLHTRYDRGSLAVENAVADILLAEHEPQAIIIVGTFAPAAKFIRLLKSNGINALFVNISFVGSQNLAGLLGSDANGVLVTQVVPPLSEDRPLTREFLDDWNAAHPEQTPSIVSLEGYVIAVILERALRTIEGAPTRENIITALENLGPFDIGIGTELTLTPENHQASQSVWVTAIEDGRVIPYDWTRLKDR